MTLAELVAQLQVPDASARAAAVAALHRSVASNSHSLTDAKQFIFAAADFPATDNLEPNAACELLRAADAIGGDDPSPLLPALESAFARLSTSAKLTALETVVDIRTRAAAALYVRALRDYGESFRESSFPVYGGDAGPDVAYELFPSLTSVRCGTHATSLIYQMLQSFRRAGALPDTILVGHDEALIDLLRREVAAARRYQRDNGVGWRSDEAYVPHRDTVGLLFDLAGWLQSAPLHDSVRDSGDLSDPRLRRYCAVALLRRGFAVADSELEFIARAPRERWELFRDLDDLGLPARRPMSCRDQRLLAEGALVNWLCFGTELFREPDEIELIHVETRARRERGGIWSWLRRRTTRDYYFFRYRVLESHWIGNEWRIGMAGGYARSAQPTTQSDGRTFSHFSRASDKSIQEHVAEHLNQPADSNLAFGLLKSANPVLAAEIVRRARRAK